MTEKERAIEACGFLRGFSYLCTTAYVYLARNLYGDNLSTCNAEVREFAKVLCENIGTICNYVESGGADEG